MRSNGWAWAARQDSWASLDQVDGDGARAAAAARVPAASAAAAAGVAHVGGDGAPGGEGAEDITEAAAEEGVAEERVTEQGERHGQQWQCFVKVVELEQCQKNTLQCLMTMLRS